VNNLNGGNFHNVYNERIEAGNENHVSYNGGQGGIEARPTSGQEAAARQSHIPAGAAQNDHAQAARANPAQRAGVNHGKPAIAATSKPGDFSGSGAARARDAEEPARGATGGEAASTRAAVHPNDLPPISRPAAVNSGDARADKKYEAQQDKLIAKQTAERQQLQQKQDSEHQKSSFKANSQKVEQKHQTQTQALRQRHATQQQSLQSRQPQARSAGPGSRR
jgi:hypothetical protein